MSLSPDDIKNVDALTPSPSIRGDNVYRFLANSDKFTNWDLLCFCAEYVAASSIPYEWLKPVARVLVKVIYTVHYLNKGFPNEARVPTAKLASNVFNETPDRSG